MLLQSTTKMQTVSNYTVSHDRFPSYLILFHSTYLVFTSMINKQKLFPEFCLTTA